MSFEDDFVGIRQEAVRSILGESTDPLSLQLTDFVDHTGKFRRASFFEGTTLGKR